MHVYYLLDDGGGQRNTNTMRREFEEVGHFHDDEAKSWRDGRDRRKGLQASPGLTTIESSQDFGTS